MTDEIMIKCPCCDGLGMVDADCPVPLSPMQFRIWDAVRRAKDGITTDELVDIVYQDHEHGGPAQAVRSVAVTAHLANKRLASVGQAISSRQRVYRLHRVEK